VILERCAGILIPLFSLRTADDLGRGDLGGLVPMGELAAAMGHRLLQLLPIDETAPGQASPYSAESVLAIDPSYLAARHLAGVSEESLAAARREISAGNLSPRT
jgi:4-alpha-glucanotransferase